jgi:hypothetical protein
MIKSEQAQEVLRELRKEDWVEVNMNALGRLPASARAIGRGILGRDADGKEHRDWQKTQQERAKAVGQLDREAPTQRQKLFAVLFPKLESQVEAAWQLLGQLPYHIGYDRKA